jgi:hypothetical protein
MFRRWAQSVLRSSTQNKMKLLKKKVRLLSQKIKVLQAKIKLLEQPVQEVNLFEEVDTSEPRQPVTIRVHHNMRVFSVQASLTDTVGDLRDEITGVIGTARFRMIMEGKELRVYNDNLRLDETEMDWQGEPLWVTE